VIPRLQNAPLRFHSMRTRLMLWNGITLALILTLLGGIVHYSVQAGLLSSVDRELRRRAEELVHGPPPFAPPPPRRREVDRPSGREANRYHPRILNLEGLPMPPFGPDPSLDPEGFTHAAQGEEVTFTRVLEDEPVRIFSRPVWGEDRIVGVAQTAQPILEVNQAVSGVNRTLMALIPVALLLAGVGGALLTDRALRPMRQITRTAEQIGGQDLSRRLQVVGEDEFADLARTFNGMLARLETTFVQQQSLVQQLQNAVEQQQRFTGDASHELRTPLTIIKANSSLALRGNPSSEEYRETIEEINQAADSMAHLIQDLLMLARADEGHLGRNRDRLSIREILEQAATRVGKPTLAPIELTFPDESGSMMGNQEELLRLFSNLLENALRWTPPEGKISVIATVSGKAMHITVTDTGIGIAHEHLPHLCERFYRADSARSRPDGGTGLGLAICQSIVEAHRGTMTIQSTVGKGTSICILLPRDSS
jgi:signal transduction histidine kinase